MSKSSFYYLLSSKVDLFEFVIRELTAGIAPQIAAHDPEYFAGEQFWLHLEHFFSRLLMVSQQNPDFLLLGRMCYLPAPDAATSALGGTLSAVRDWVHGVLRVGRQCGAVRTDLPDELQSELVFSILQTFDAWTIARYDDMAPTELQELAGAQFTTIRRTLAP